MYITSEQTQTIEVAVRATLFHPERDPRVRETRYYTRLKEGVYLFFTQYKEPTGFAVHDAERFVADFYAWQLNLVEYDFRAALRALSTPTVEALRSLEFRGALGSILTAEYHWRRAKSDEFDWSYKETIDTVRGFNLRSATVIAKGLVPILNRTGEHVLSELVGSSSISC